MDTALLDTCEPRREPAECEPVRTGLRTRLCVPTSQRQVAPFFCVAARDLPATSTRTVGCRVAAFCLAGCNLACNHGPLAVTGAVSVACYRGNQAGNLRCGNQFPRTPGQSDRYPPDVPKPGHAGLLLLFGVEVRPKLLRCFSGPAPDIARTCQQQTLD
jgi:hypothetical protein